MSTQISILPEAPKAGFTITIPDEARRQKEMALVLASAIKEVSSDQQQNQAVTICGTLKGLLKATEKSRKEVKQPVLDAGKAIDAVAKKYVKELQDEVDRIEKLLGDFVQVRQELSESAETEKVEGASVQERYEYEVLNIFAFLDWARQNGRQDFLRIEINKKEFNEWLSVATQKMRGAVPGVKITAHNAVAVRSIPAGIPSLQ